MTNLFHPVEKRARDAREHAEHAAKIGKADVEELAARGKFFNDVFDVMNAARIAAQAELEQIRAAALDELK